MTAQAKCRRAAALVILVGTAACNKGEGSGLPFQTVGKQPDVAPVMLNKELPFRYPPALYAQKVQGNVTLRIYIDRPEGGNVSIDDCTRASRDIGTALDVADLLHVPYSLEVSSPGLDRPLRREKDFARFAGKRARLRVRDPIDGRRNFAGTLKGVEDGRVAIECDGQVYRLPLSELAKANLEMEI